ncbi:MAG: hypothetical protein DYG93_02885 [Leptolyngbya sp. PLA2]|nr:hypothetical protein [Leptolyngbya sp.]MCE7970601.1 hypothetical protein [Leptolyngbya sp. PL-A2]MCQ3939755.1 hypothetical protein [cyanobacterium CYA1]MCZ7633322.1 hypothetical protein [Phycisphaerales bacterium]MDL1903500.1 hypothetical protein [Synechococcales cyanobacterium CNB]GIK18199.1 MAG: hypothetical protein BroJett004_03630 [Planctomycetota bacterium]
MSLVQVGAETETDRGWSYEVRVAAPGGGVTRHVVTLAWVDHDYWCGGTRPPSEVIERLVTFVAGRIRAGLPERFDAATARRWLPDVDTEMMRSLAPHE